MKKQISKRIALLSSLLLFSSIAGRAESASIVFKVGFLKPKDVGGTGVIFGGTFGQAIDDHLTLGVSVDYFNKTFSDEKEVERRPTGTGSYSKVLQTYDFHVRYLPVMASALITIPMVGMIKPYGTANLGYGLANVSYDFYALPGYDYQVDTSDKGWYSGFNWRISGGAKLKLGFRSAIIGELFYNGGGLTRTEGNIKWKKDMSGIGGTLGLSITTG
ncbi:MAG: hypothetical protein AB1393_14280 [Candidatus Edwardsbacteria bacterium]